MKTSPQPTTTTIKTIQRVVTHAGAHLEELLITWLFTRFGRRAGYKIADNFSFEENRIGSFAKQERSLESWVSAGILPVGTFGTRELDEHSSDTGNRKSKSAVALASKLLFSGKPTAGVWNLIRFASGEDQNAGKGGYNLAYVCKILRTHPDGMDSMRLYKWLCYFFNSENRVKQERISVRRDSDLLKDLLTKYKDENPGVKMALFSRFVNNPKCDPVELKNYNPSILVNTLYDSGVEFTDIYQWAKLFFDAEVYRQDVLWPKTQSDAAKNTLLFDSKKGPVIAFFESDDEMAHAAVRVAFGKKVHLVVIKRSTGHYQMFSAKACYGGPSLIDLDDTVMVLRWSEGSRGTEEELKSENFEGSLWYYHIAAESILNGSHSAPDVPETNLSTDEVISLVQSSVYFRPKEDCVVSAAPAFKGVKVAKKGKVKVS